MKFSSSLFLISAFITCLSSYSLYASQLDAEDEHSNALKMTPFFYGIDAQGKNIGDITIEDGKPVSTAKGFSFIKYEILNGKHYSGPPLIVIKDASVGSIHSTDWSLLISGNVSMNSNAKWNLGNGDFYNSIECIKKNLKD